MTPGFLMIIQVFMGESRSWAVGIFTLALFLNGAVTAGYLGNGLDIAPNFSGTIFGMANTLSSFGGFVSAYMVGILTTDNVSTIMRYLITIVIITNDLLRFAANLRPVADRVLDPSRCLHRWLFGVPPHGYRRAAAVEQPTGNRHYSTRD